MKTKSLLISLIVILSTFLLMQRSWLPRIFGKAEETEGSRSQVELTYYLHQRRPFSLDIVKSDYFRNYVLMTNLIGTLVRSDNAGKYGLHIAEDIKKSLDKKTWIFRIKEGLTCESGEPISAEGFVKSLTKSLKRYAIQGRLLEFEKLSGSELLSREEVNSIDGLKADGRDVVFTFNSPPEQLFERLADPYFGFLCQQNFKDTDSREWAEDLSVVSSGPYRVSEVVSDREIVLEYRDSFNGPEPKFKRVRFKIIPSVNEVDFSRRPFVVQLNEKVPEQSGIQVVRGTPTFTVNLSLPIWEKSIFQSVESRRYFFQRLYYLKKESVYSDASSVPADSFFPLDNKNYFDKSYESEFVPKWRFKDRTDAIVSLSTVLPDAHKDYILELLNRIGDEMNFSVVLYDAKKHTPIKPTNIKPFDIRVTSVHMGSIPYFSVIDMVFCSELGVRYSDYLGKICSFVKKNLTSHVGPLNDSQRLGFHEMIVSGGLLLPISYRSISFMYSSEIDLDSVSSSALFPMPDLIRTHYE